MIAEPWRDRIFDKQTRVIAIIKDRGMSMDAPISDCQYEAPSANQLGQCLFPDFEMSLDSFLRSFDQP